MKLRLYLPHYAIILTMKKLLLTGLLLFASHTQILAQCNENDEYKILLVGDSWAFFMGVDQTINNVMRDWGHSGYKYRTNATIAENGAETDDFLLAAKQQEIQVQLDQYPSIEVVHLSIGGNDVLGDWNINFTQERTDSLANAVLQRLDSVITFIKSARPGIQILWSGYTYPNFGEVIQSAAPFQTNHPFYGTWEGMGFPTFAQINAVQNNFSEMILNFYAADPQVKFIPANGLMQYVFGQTSPLGVAPGGTYPAFSVPMPGGNPIYPSPKTTMRNYGLTRDCFHLSADGYYQLISYHTQKFYHKFLMDDFYALSTASETGSVSSSSNVSAELLIGEANSEVFASVLSFDVAMPDTTIKKASVFLRIEEVTGTNLLNGTLEVKMKHGTFGAEIVEAVDFTAVGDASGTPCTFGSTSAGKWVRIDLPPSMLSFIADGKVQFIVSAPGANGSKVKFSNSTDPDFAPVLNLKYGINTASVAENNEKEPKAYPVPTTGLLHIENESGLTGFFVTDLSGRKMDFKSVDSKTIDISALPEGIYLLNFQDATAVHSKKILKTN